MTKATIASYNFDEDAVGHVPEVWEDCPNCCGEGVIYKTILVYERGCGFGHDDVAAETCPTCDGTRGMICEATGDSK